MERVWDKEGCKKFEQKLGRVEIGKADVEEE